jgi:hypothetical protein
MKDKEKCFICNKDITNELPKIDVKGDHYCKDCYSAKCKKETTKCNVNIIGDIMCDKNSMLKKLIDSEHIDCDKPICDKCPAKGLGEHCYEELILKILGIK